MERRKNTLKKGRRSCHERINLHIAREKYKKEKNKVKGSGVCRMESSK